MLSGIITAKPAVLYVFAAVFAFLAAASIVTLLIRATRGGLEEVWLRIKTWWIMIGLLAIAISTNEIVTLGFFALVSFLALREFFSIVPTRRADRIILLVAFLMIPVQYYLVYIQWYGLFIILIPVYGFLVFPLLMVSTGETEGFLKAVSTVHWGLMTGVFALSHAAYLLALPESKNAAGSAGLLLYLLIITQFNDVLQFLWGKALGRHAITPKVSPKKTWEGFVGGLITTAGVSYLLAPLLTPLSAIESVWIGALLAAAGFAGDVNMSAVKRDIRVKDAGSILPGHGGVLDRVDSLTFTAPLFFHLVYWIHY